MSRFHHRPKRINRRMERDTFALIVMPAAVICGVVGLAVLAAAILHFLVSSQWSRELLSAGLGLSVLPVLLAAFRIVRGHYSRSLNEP